MSVPGSSEVGQVQEQVQPERAPRAPPAHAQRVLRIWGYPDRSVPRSDFSGGRPSRGDPLPRRLRGSRGASWYLLPVSRGSRAGGRAVGWSGHWVVRALGQGRHEAGGRPPRLITCPRAAAAGPRPGPGCPRTRQPSPPDGARRWAWRAGPQVSRRQVNGWPPPPAPRPGPPGRGTHFPPVPSPNAFHQRPAGSPTRVTTAPAPSVRPAEMSYS